MVVVLHLEQHLQALCKDQEAEHIKELGLEAAALRAHYLWEVTVVNVVQLLRHYHDLLTPTNWEDLVALDL